MKVAYITALLSTLVLTACSSLPPTTSMAPQPNSMWQHLEKFQQIAQENQNNRAVGSEGGKMSGGYIRQYAHQLGLTAQGMIFVNRDETVGQNILIEIEGKNKDQAIILGAHYDSVTMGPGINDNASGVAVLLSVMEHYAKQQQKPPFNLYFAFWDSEEVGIAGSQHFVSQLTDQQLKGIRAYINVDMVGTQNPTALLLDADKSSVDEMQKMLQQNGMAEADYLPLLQGLRRIPGHAGDAYLQQVLTQFFQEKKVPIREDISTVTASDTAPFLGLVPVASLVLFNERMKGDILEFAPCYHQACNDITHIDPQSLALTRSAIFKLIQAIEQP
jgi:aminopeptidase S